MQVGIACQEDHFEGPLLLGRGAIRQGPQRFVDGTEIHPDAVKPNNLDQLNTQGSTGWSAS